MLNRSLFRLIYYESIIFLISFFIGMPVILRFISIRSVLWYLFSDVKHWTLFVCVIVDLIVVFSLFYAWSAITLINLFINQIKNRLNYSFSASWHDLYLYIYIYYWINTLHLFEFNVPVFDGVQCSPVLNAPFSDGCSSKWTERNSWITKIIMCNEYHIKLNETETTTSTTK